MIILQLVIFVYAEFLVTICGFAENKASSLRVELFKTYGSTLAGLRVLITLLLKEISLFKAFIG